MKYKVNNKVYNTLKESLAEQNILKLVNQSKLKETLEGSFKQYDTQIYGIDE